MATRETNSRWRATAPAITTTRIGSNETDTNTACMGARIALQDRVKVRRLAGGIADCLQDWLRSATAGPTPITDTPTFTFRNEMGGWWSGARHRSTWKCGHRPLVKVGGGNQSM